MTNSYIEYKNHIAFHPSYYLHDLINQLNMTQDEFAERVNTTPKTISKILNGLARVTPKLAYQISLVTNTSAELWNNLQKKYDEVQVIVEDQKLLDQESKLLDIIDYKYFIDNKFLPVARSREEKVLNLRKFLKVASLNVISKATPSANFRMSNGSLNDKNIINSYIWLQTAINISTNIEVDNFNENRLRLNLDKIRNMTVQTPDNFYEDLVNTLKDCGIAFVLLPHLRNSGINGVTKWINNDKVLVALNDRSYKADTFWFSLFHELKHVLQQKIKKTLINAIEKEEVYPEHEKEADNFARDLLIPMSQYSDFIKEENFTEERILNFAKLINIHPGIVVGRMQYDKHIPYSSFNNLKETYRIEI